MLLIGAFNHRITFGDLDTSSIDKERKYREDWYNLSARPKSLDKE